MRAIEMRQLRGPALRTRATEVSRVLRALPPQVLDAVLATSTVRLCGPHDALRLQGSRDDSLCVFLEGAAKEHVLTVAGEDRVTGLVGPGDSVGIETVFAATAAVTCVTALTSVAVVSIPGPSMREAVTLSGDAARALIAEEATRLVAAVESDVSQTSVPAPQRVVARLVELADGWSTPVDLGHAITVPLTQEELGSWAGVSRETVSKVLHDLRGAGLLRTGRRRLVVTRPDALRTWRPDTNGW